MDRSTKPRAPRKPWSVLAYMVADDKSGALDLDTLAKQELIALCTAASASEFRHLGVAAQVDFKRRNGVHRAAINPPRSRGGFEPVAPEGLWKQILSLVPRREEDVSKSVFTLEKDRDDLNAAGGRVLQEFVSFGHDECPSDRQLLFFYGHASGPMGLFYDNDKGQRVPKTLRLFELADAIRRGQEQKRPASLIMFRDCWMNTLEVACQLSSVAEFMIASQSIVPARGAWPWPDIIDALQAKTDTADHAIALVDAMIRYFDEESNRQGFADTPVTLLDLGAATAIAEPLKQLTNELIAVRNSRDAVALDACVAALEGARGFDRSDPDHPLGDPALIDVLTLCENLTKAPAPVASAAAGLAEAVRAMVKRHRSQAAKSRFSGTSLYYEVLPDGAHSLVQAADEAAASDDATDYKRLALVRESGWWRLALHPLARRV